jgi:hypothetical protein
LNQASSLFVKGRRSTSAEENSATCASVRRFEPAAIDRDMLAVIASLSETPGEY